MSTNQPNNSNDIIASVLAQYLEQQRQRQAHGNSGAGDQQQRQTSAPTQVAEQQVADLSSSLLAAFSSLAASTTAAAPPSAVSFPGPQPPAGTLGGFCHLQPEAPTPNLAMNQPQQGPPSNMNSASLSQQILASAQLLAAINPNFDAAAVTHALSLNSQQPQQEQQRQVAAHQNQTQVSLLSEVSCCLAT